MRQFLSFIFCFFGLTSLGASSWTNWTENPSDPVFNPGYAYYPSVCYDPNKFGDNSGYYKMWYAGSTNLQLTYSNDGISWQAPINLVGLPGSAAHPIVVYDKNGFGATIYKYKMWYWSGALDITSIQFSQSTNGINWTAPQQIQQDPLNKLVTGLAGYFAQLYGPAYVIYNPQATSTPGQPYSYPYVMIFDTASSGTGTTEQTGLAYSLDGILWSRYGAVPILIPSGNLTDWDSQYTYHPSLFQDMYGIYHMFYSGANGGAPGLYYAQGIGHASSVDGITWAKDPDNPVFYVTDGVAWRNYRTYTPWVIFHPFCDLGNPPVSYTKMWFTGATNVVRAIGMAALSCPPLIPLITNTNPNFGWIEGGVQIILTGKFFSTAFSVTFGTVVATFVINSDTQMTVTVPPNYAGTYDIRVTNLQGISDVNPSDRYTYINSLVPYPPKTFQGLVKKNRFLNRNTYFLESAWSPSISTNTIFYRLYKNGVLLEEIPASGPFTYNIPLHTKHVDFYEVSAVNNIYAESSKTPMQVIYE